MSRVKLAVNLEKISLKKAKNNCEKFYYFFYFNIIKVTRGLNRGANV